MPVPNPQIPIQPAPLTPSSKDLPITHIQQTQTEWCWAACAQMVLNYYGHNVSQCDLANILLGKKTCCHSPGPLHFFFKCNSRCTAPQVSQLYGSFKLNSLYNANPVSFPVIQAEINAAQPVEVGFAWFGGGGHLAIIRGWEQDNIGDWIKINDPSPSFGNSGQGVMLYSKLSKPYGMGSWIATWTDLK